MICQAPRMRGQRSSREVVCYLVLLFQEITHFSFSCVCLLVKLTEKDLAITRQRLAKGSDFGEDQAVPALHNIA